jgi:hypothetical protein
MLVFINVRRNKLFNVQKKEILNSFDKELLTKSINLYADLKKISLKRLSV